MKTEISIVFAAVVIGSAVVFANHQRIEYERGSYVRCMERATPLRIENFRIGADKVLTDQEIIDSINAKELCISSPAVRH